MLLCEHYTPQCLADLDYTIVMHAACCTKHNVVHCAVSMMWLPRARNQDCVDGMPPWQAARQKAQCIDMLLRPQGGETRLKYAARSLETGFLDAPRRERIRVIDKMLTHIWSNKS